ncbi:MAG: site-specific integrase [Microbacteriaceae bacterium]|nr:site-specific integrase [Microbacteriaceae bacterium]
MLTKTNSGRYRVRVFHKSLQVASKTFDRAKDAEKWEAAQKLALYGGEWISPTAGDITLGDLITQFNKDRKGPVRPHSWDTDETNLRLHISATLKRRPISSITAGQLETMFNEMLRTHARGTVSRHRDSVSVLFAYAVRHGIVRENLVTKVKLARGTGEPKQEIRPFTEAERDGLIKTIRRTHPDAADVVEILARTGVRWGELCALRVSDIRNDMYPTIFVRESESDGYDATDPKSGKPRRVPLDDRSVEILAALTVGMKSTDRIFQNSEGGKLLGGNFTRAVKWATIAPGQRLHDLRHTAATLWLQNSIDISTVAAWLGHSNSSTTHKAYLHYMKADADVAGIARINARDTQRREAEAEN